MTRMVEMASTSEALYALLTLEDLLPKFSRFIISIHQLLLLSLSSSLINRPYQPSRIMKKMVLKVELCDDRTKRKAMEAVSGLPGVVSVSVDMKDKKLTVRGNIDPVIIVEKLKKLCRTEIVSVEPIKEPEKKKEDSKRTAKKPEKKEEPKKEEKKNQVAVAKPLKGPRPSPGFLVQNRREEYVHIRMQEKKGEKNLTIVQVVKKDFNYKKIP